MDDKYAKCWSHICLWTLNKGNFHKGLREHTWVSMGVAFEWQGESCFRALMVNYCSVIVRAAGWRKQTVLWTPVELVGSLARSHRNISHDVIVFSDVACKAWGLGEAALWMISDTPACEVYTPSLKPELVLTRTGGRPDLLRSAFSKYYSMGTTSSNTSAGFGLVFCWAFI